LADRNGRAAVRSASRSNGSGHSNDMCLCSAIGSTTVRTKKLATSVEPELETTAWPTETKMMDVVFVMHVLQIVFPIRNRILVAA